jgi:uncharacterized membrane protein YdjX (TVP38/TMEM64 family)
VAGLDAVIPMLASKVTTGLKLVLVACFVAAVIYFFRATEAGRQIARDPGNAAVRLKDYVGTFDPLTARLLYVAAYIGATVLFIPGTVPSFAGALLFGPYQGTLLTWLGATIGATLAYLLARWLGRDFVEHLFAGRFAAFDRRIRENGFIGLLIIRLLPVFPFFAVNFGCGLTGIRLRDYVLATAIGIIPGTFVYQLAFAKFGEEILIRGFRWELLKDPELWAVLGVFVAFIGVGKWLAGKVGRKAPNAEENPTPV